MKLRVLLECSASLTVKVAKIGKVMPTQQSRRPQIVFGRGLLCVDVSLARSFELMHDGQRRRRVYRRGDKPLGVSNLFQDHRRSFRTLERLAMAIQSVI